MVQKIGILVIGAGQAGLSLGYYLSQRSASFLLVDSCQQIGDSWRNRYDSLTLFTPKAYSSLPGLRMPGNQWEYPTKDEMAEYMASYQQHFSIPVSLNTTVLKVEKSGDGFYVETNKGSYQAKQVIISTGPFQKPYVPEMANQLAEDVYQVHTSLYANPEQLPDGPVVIVGAGSSGGQIAVECSREREVILSMSKPITYLPYKFLGRSLFWWYDKLGLLEKGPETRIGKKMRAKPDPMYGFELKKLIEANVIKVKPRAVHARQALIEFADQSTVHVKNVIWATGYYSDYSWIKIPTLFDQNGEIIHKKGISSVHGLYFLGLPWQTSRGSGLVGWVGRDAKFISEQVISSQYWTASQDLAGVPQSM